MKLYAVGMQLINGKNLDQCFGLDDAVKTKYILQVTEGLSWLHQRGIMHRDIKPQNILVDANGDKVLGFSPSYLSKYLGCDSWFWISFKRQIQQRNRRIS